MYRVITCNTNGIRAAARKGFFDWLASQKADVVCIQEIKAKEEQLSRRGLSIPRAITVITTRPSDRVMRALRSYCKQKPQKVITRLDWEIVDSEGRYIQVDFPGLSVVSLYVPSGSASEVAQARKDGFMEPFYEHLAALRRKRREFIVCADWNTCHQNIDLKNWRSNQKNSGFMPHERAWLDRIYDESANGWIFFARLLTNRICIPGGPIVGRPGRTMSGGGWTTCWSRPACLGPGADNPSIATKGSLITHRSPLILPFPSRSRPAAHLRLVRTVMLMIHRLLAHLI